MSILILVLKIKRRLNIASDLTLGTRKPEEEQQVQSFVDVVIPVFHLLTTNGCQKQSVNHVPTKFLIMFILDHIDPTPTILLVNLLDYNGSMMKRFSKICHSPKYLLYSLEPFLIQ